MTTYNLPRYFTNSGTTTTKEVVLTSITANNADITVGGNTNLKGSLIAAGYYDENGNFIDNDNLNLTTNTLTFSNLNSSSYSTNSSVGGGVSLNQNKQGETLPNASSATYNASSGMSYSKEKTLATLGGGNVTITDTVNSDDLTKLNRDTSKINKELYSGGVSSDVSATVDMRMFTEDGRKDIAEDVKKAQTVTRTLLEMATTDSVSFIGDKANGETGFFQSVEDKNALMEATKKFVNNPNNKEILDILNNPNSSDKEILAANQTLHNYIALEMGITPTQLNNILDTSYKGFTSSQTGEVYIATNLHDNMGDMANTVINETSDIVDMQRDAGVEKTDNYLTNRDEYSTNFGNLGQEYLDAQWSSLTGVALSDIAYNQVNANLQDYSQEIYNNTQEFAGLDKSQGAHRQLNNNEINFIRLKATDYAKIFYKTSNPTSAQIQSAEHMLAQQALRQVDKEWSLILGNKTDIKAKAFLDANAPNLFKVKDQYEFIDGTTNGKTEISDLTDASYEKLKNFYFSNTNVSTPTNLNGSRDLGSAFAKDANDKLDSFSWETVNESIRQLIPNTVNGIINTPETLNSTKNFIEAVYPYSKTNDRLDELYQQGSLGSQTQANLATMDTINTMGMVVGGAGIVKGVGGTLMNSAEKSILEHANLSTHNGASDTVVLGKHIDGSSSSYEQVAKSMDATYFQMSKTEWNALENKYGKEYMWNVNKQFLDTQIEKGKTFVFTSDPKDFPKKTFRYDEYEYLKNNGYTLKDLGDGTYGMYK